MSDRCLFCRSKLGKNDILPGMPAGRKLAFDPANARVWIVCPKCERWNMAPLDDAGRRSAVERLERFYTATSRAEQYGIGVAEIEGRGSLIRVGEVTWAQFASWRYVARARHHPARRLAWSAFCLGLAALAWTPAGTAFLVTWTGQGVLYAWIAWTWWWYFWRPAFHVRDDRGARRAVRLRHLRHTAIAVDDTGWRVLVSRDGGVSEIRGAQATAALARILMNVNLPGTRRADIDEALELITRAGGPEPFFATRLTVAWLGAGTHRIAELPKPFVLALEIAAREASERRAFMGELAAVRGHLSDAEETSRAEGALVW